MSSSCSVAFSGAIENWCPCGPGRSGETVKLGDLLDEVPQAGYEQISTVLCRTCRWRLLFQGHPSKRVALNPRCLRTTLRGVVEQPGRWQPVGLVVVEQSGELQNRGFLNGATVWQGLMRQIACDLDVLIRSFLRSASFFKMGLRSVLYLTVFILLLCQHVVQVGLSFFFRALCFIPALSCYCCSEIIHG